MPQRVKSWRTRKWHLRVVLTRAPLVGLWGIDFTLRRR